MTDVDKISQLEKRIEELEGYLSQFESFRSFRKRDNKHSTAAIATTNKPRPTNGKGTRLSEDWQPNEQLITWAIKEFPAVDLTLETAKFADYWISRADRGAIKLDWNRTWRNWIRTASTSYRRESHGSRQPERLDFTHAVRTSFD